MNITGIIIATIVQFVIGAIWYSLLFGKLWGKIHGFDKLDPKVQKEMASKMGPFYGLQLVVTIITSVVLSKLIQWLPETSPYLLALLVWVGFVVPTQVSDVIFGGTDAKWIVKKLVVLAGASLACLLGAAVVFSLIA